jgi:intracellular multiplication protein IcmK
MSNKFFKKSIIVIAIASIFANYAAASDETDNPFGGKIVQKSESKVRADSREVDAMPPPPLAAVDSGESSGGRQSKAATHEELNPPFNPIETLKKSRLSPDEILEIRKVIQEENASKELPLAGRAIPTVRPIKIDLSPDATPPIIRISKGAGATIVFTRSGQPVEIETYINFAKKQISVNEFGTGMLAVSALMDEQHNAAFAVRLKDIPVPIQFTVLTAQLLSDYRIDAYLPPLSMGSRSPLSISQEDSDLSTAMMFAMTNIVPDGYAKGVASAGQVFIKKESDEMIYRIRGTLISPALPESSRLESPDGMKCYSLPQVGVLSVLIDGQISTVKIEGI